MITDIAYRAWVIELSSRYQTSQIKAVTSVNTEMLKFYWTLGRDIVAMDAENTYGSAFYKTLSADLRATLPNAKGFSASNLRYMKRFYELYTNFQQLAELSEQREHNEIFQQVAEKLSEQKNPLFSQGV